MTVYEISEALIRMAMELNAFRKFTKGNKIRIVNRKNRFHRYTGIIKRITKKGYVVLVEGRWKENFYEGELKLLEGEN